MQIFLLKSQSFKFTWDKKQNRNFPGGPVVKTLHFYCRGHGFDLWRASLVAQMVKNLPAMPEPGFNPWVGKIP